MTLFLLILHTAALSAAAAIVAGPAAAAPPAGCGVNLSAPAVISAIKSLPPCPGTDSKWSSAPTTLEGNFNPCVTLSTALVTVEGPTASSPITALMFNKGSYLGTATSKAEASAKMPLSKLAVNSQSRECCSPGWFVRY